MLSSDNYNMRMDEVHYFLKRKDDYFVVRFGWKFTKSTNDAICFGGH